MEAFTLLRSRALHLDQRNVDTDQVLPARFLRNPRKAGYADFLFHDMRFDPEGRPHEDFLLNRPGNRDAGILVAGENFGCGSSREGAVYGLVDWGFRCVVAPSFGDIFRNNCIKNGLLPAPLAADAIARLLAQGPEAEWTVDLRAQTIQAGPVVQAFDIQPFWKTCLLEGVDDIDLTLRQRDRIDAFARQHLAARPWLPLDFKDWQAGASR